MKFSKEIFISDYKIYNNSPTYIIAEIGTNHHHGDMEIIKRMIKEAKNMGANAVKFQTFITEKLIARGTEHASRLNSTLEQGQTWYDLLVSEELTFDKHFEINNYCKEQNIDFISTPYDKESLDFLCEEINVPALKIASADLVNHPLLRQCAKKKIPIIMSTGMSELEDVIEALEVINDCGNNDVVLMHCTGIYPTNIEDCNLNVIKLYKEKFDCIVGYSDHCLSNIVPVLAVGLGAKVYEKHFTLSKYMPGADHQTSFDPDEFLMMIDDIRKTEIILGSQQKHILSGEIENKNKYRRSLVANLDIPRGEKVTIEMLGVKRPGNGLPPKELLNIVGLRTKVDLLKDTVIDKTMFY
jgi:N-acetylneuraminate synthase/N,N'-diacetyllegionaminate synthase